MRIYNKRYLKSKRKKLRNNSTYPEKFLWQELRRSRLQGRKFSRQISIGNYVADFYCRSERLVVELDGDYHFDPEQIEYDKRRTKYLESLGIRVIRFENQEVLYNTEKTLREIVECFEG